MKKLNPKATWLFFFRSCFTGIVIFGILFVALWKVILNKSLLPYFIIALLIYFLFGYVWTQFAYKNWKYDFVEKGIKIEKGVISKDYTTVPYERIQNVDIHRGIVDRLLGLSALHIQTAGERIGSEGNLPGLSTETAEEIREKLSKRKGTKKGGL